MTPEMDPIGSLARVPASDVKKLGWRGVMRTLAPKGKVVVTNHDTPEAVVLSMQEYERIVQVMNQVESKADAELEALRRRFDERLATLQGANSGQRLRSVMGSRAQLHGKVKAGSGY